VISYMSILCILEFRYFIYESDCLNMHNLIPFSKSTLSLSSSTLPNIFLVCSTCSAYFISSLSLSALPCVLYLLLNNFQFVLRNAIHNAYKLVCVCIDVFIEEHTCYLRDMNNFIPRCEKKSIFKA
jgi:hypothetical protein